MRLLLFILLFPFMSAGQSPVSINTAGIVITVNNGKPIEIRTVVSADTILYRVDYASEALAIAAAQASGKWLQLPATYNMSGQINIVGNFKLLGASGGTTITDNTTKSEGGFLIRLENGNHSFKNITFYHPGDSVVNYNAVQTAPDDISWNNNFYNCKFTGNWYNNYQSSGGHGTTGFYNCNMKADSENIQYFSQHGTKTLIMWDDTLNTKLSHCVYTHPINNYNVRRVIITGTGKLGWNSYGTSEAVTVGVNSYQNFIGLRCSDTATAKIFGGVPMQRLWSSYAPINIDSSRIAPYEMAASACNISNTYWFNAGNGIGVSNNAVIHKCTGSMSVAGGNFASFDSSNLSVGLGTGCSITSNRDTLTVNSGPILASTFTNTRFVGHYDYANPSALPNSVTFNSCTFNLTSFGTCLRVTSGSYSGFTYNSTATPCIDDP